MFKKSLQNLKVLIVDDNEVSRGILKEQISAFGVDAVTVASGRAAIQQVKDQAVQKPFDLVIMDWRMPEMDGIETAKAILDDTSIDHTPMAIMVSAFGREDVAKKAEKIGIRNFLMKPINQSLLFDTIVNMFDMDKSGMTIQSGSKPDDDMGESRLDGVRILLVEDNVINQEVATEIIFSAGATVEVANNGKEALEAVAENCYDLILMDLQMPVMGGYEATKFIRAERKNQDLPIIAMTAHAMQGVEAECKAAGMNDYVSKPIDPKNLFSTILKWLGPDFSSKHSIYQSPTKTGQERTGETKLPDRISGVDMPEGLNRVGGNQTLYVKLLHDFADNYQAYADIMKKAISDKNFEEAKRFAHTLKGVAGNISAHEIFSVSEQIEKALSAEPCQDCSMLLEQLNQSLHGFVLAMEGMAGGERPPAGEELLSDTAIDAEPILQEAAHLIWTDDVDAEKVIPRLRQALGKRFPAEIEEIAAGVDGFDFERAKKPIQKIAAELSIKLDGADNE